MRETTSFKPNTEQNEGETREEQQLKCEYCESKWKRKATMNKHINNKNNKTD